MIRLINLTRTSHKISMLELRDLTYLIKWIELKLTQSKHDKQHLMLTIFDITREPSTKLES